MPAPHWLAQFNRRVPNRVLAPLARVLPGMGVVVHRGRKTQREYRTPVLVFRRGNHVIIALTYGPDTDWVRNILAHGGGALETRGRTITLAQPRLFRDERRQAMPPLIRQMLGVGNVSDFLEMTPVGKA